MSVRADSDLPIQTWDALKGAFWPIFLDISEKTRETRTTPAQISLLFVLFTSPQSVTPLEVSRALRIAPGTVTGTLNPLEEKGLIERGRGETADRRVVHLRLTSKGRELLKGWLESSRTIIDKRMTRLSDQEQRRLIALLGRIGPPIPGVPENLGSLLRLNPPGRPKDSKARVSRPTRSTSRR
jgi:DNA-binding MarR family transcriptional regulator